MQTTARTPPRNHQSVCLGRDAVMSTLLTSDPALETRNQPYPVPKPKIVKALLRLWLYGRCLHQIIRIPVSRPLSACILRLLYDNANNLLPHSKHQSSRLCITEYLSGARQTLLPPRPHPPPFLSACYTRRWATWHSRIP